MDISSLQAFIAVAQQQSFSAASELLFITQPAVSKRVASLEDQLNIQLFNRINRQISLTDSGLQLLPKAQELVNQAKDLQRFAASLSNDVSGTLSIAISHHIALYRMPPILKAFSRDYPQVQLDIRFEDSDQAFNAVERGDIELAIITLPSNLPSNLVAMDVWQDELNVVVGQEHALNNKHNKKLSLAQLAEYPSVLTTKETETNQIVERVFAQAELSLNVQMRSNNLQSLKMLVTANIGWSLLPSTMLDDSVCHLAVEQQFSRRLGIVMHQKRSLSNAAQAMKSLLS